MLVEEIENRGHLVGFLPKFHCELNWIKSYWGEAKRYARENCTYSLDGLRTTIPLALASVSNSTIHGYYHHCMRRIQAYRAGLGYGLPEFGEHGLRVTSLIDEFTLKPEICRLDLKY